MERKYNEIFDDAFLLPKAVVEALDKLEQEEIKNIYKQEGFEMRKAEEKKDIMNI